MWMVARADVVAMLFPWLFMLIAMIDCLRCRCDWQEVVIGLMVVARLCQ